MLWCTNMGFKIIYVSMGLCLCPMQEMGMNFEHHGTVALWQTLSTCFCNSSKSKSRAKFMKLGMLSWSGIKMPW